MDCYDQTSSVMSKSSDDSAMVKAVETPSVAVETGTYSIESQRTETTFRLRNYVLMKSGEARVTVSDSSQKQAGDSSRENGGTWKLLDSSLTTRETSRCLLSRSSTSLHQWYRPRVRISLALDKTSSASSLIVRL